MTTFRIKVLLSGLFLAAGILVLLFTRRLQSAATVPGIDTASVCASALTTQAVYLDNEPHSREQVFSRYPASPIPTFPLAPLDVNSSPLTREFQTRLRQQLASRDINFASHYSLVSVGMTGWGMNYWIVDRRTGRAREFPFHAMALEVDAGSSLIIMNPKDSIRALLRESEEGGCYFLNQEQVSDVRPFYFQWKNDTLSLLAPSELTPPVNAFWLDYRSGIPEGTPAPLAVFVREIRKGVIRSSNRVPSEGYNGFMIVEAFPGITAEDFAGVTTLNGDYGGRDGRLEFTGNASLDAPAMTLEGMSMLLRNIGRRLSMPASTEAEVTTLIKRISQQG